MPSWLRQDPGEIAEMVDRERNVGICRLADRLAVVPGFGLGEQVEVFLEPVRDLQENVRTCRGRGPAPVALRGMGGVEGKLDVRGVGPRHLADLLAGDRGDVVEIAPVHGGHEGAADEVVVALLEGRCVSAGNLCHLVHGKVSSFWGAALARAVRGGNLRPRGRPVSRGR